MVASDIPPVEQCDVIEISGEVPEYYNNQGRYQIVPGQYYNGEHVWKRISGDTSSGGDDSR